MIHIGIRLNDKVIRCIRFEEVVQVFTIRWYHALFPDLDTNVSKRLSSSSGYVSTKQPTVHSMWGEFRCSSRRVGGSESALSQTIGLSYIRKFFSLFRDSYLSCQLVRLSVVLSVFAFSLSLVGICLTKNPNFIDSCDYLLYHLSNSKLYIIVAVNDKIVRTTGCKQNARNEKNRNIGVTQLKSLVRTS